MLAVVKGKRRHHCLLEKITESWFWCTALEVSTQTGEANTWFKHMVNYLLPEMIEKLHHSPITALRVGTGLNRKE